MSVMFFTEPSLRLDRKSVCRYMGASGLSDTALLAQTETIISEAETAPDFRVCYETVPVSVSGDEVCFDGRLTVCSKSLAAHFSCVKKAVLFCATCGAWFDRRIAASKLSVAQALIYDAAGTAAVEQLCDDFCAAIHTVGSRFSPGYGDLPLAFQAQLLQRLQADRYLGVCLTDSLLMTPVKSVTALAALEKV